MENDVLDCLNDIGYTGPLSEEGVLKEAVAHGAKSLEFTELVAYLSTELQALCNLDDRINPIKDPDHASSFLLEVSSFLKELDCPYKALLDGNVNQRLGCRQNCLLLLYFLLTELLAAKMVQANHSESSNMKIEMHESTTASSLKKILMSWGFNKPPANISSGQVFSKLDIKAKEIMNKFQSGGLSKPLFIGSLTDKQWHLLEDLIVSFKKEYQLRREMLLKRLDVTIQSFKWSENAAKNEEKIMSAFMPRRAGLNPTPNITSANLLAAREDLTVIEKVSTASVLKFTKTAINKVIIGSVPDRGGRPQEQEPPPPEMPSWQQRSAPSQAGGNNRIQGGWNKGNRGGSRGWSQRGGSDRYQGAHDKYQPQRQDQHCYDYQNTGQDQYSSSQDGYGGNSNRRGRGGHRGWGRGGRRGY